MIKNNLSIYLPIVVYCGDNNNMSKICLIAFLNTNSFCFFCILISSYNLDEKNFAILTIDVDLMITHDRLNQFIELFDSPFTGLL